MFDTAFRDPLSVRASAPGPVVVSGVADCGPGRSELGLPAGRRISAAAGLAVQRQASVSAVALERPVIATVSAAPQDTQR